VQDDLFLYLDLHVFPVLPPAPGQNSGVGVDQEQEIAFAVADKNQESCLSDDRKVEFVLSNGGPVAFCFH
jgi:hypothetical protein